MSMVKSLINKPVSVVVLASLTFIISIFMINLLPQELTPEFDFPTISVITTYPGAGPEEIESSITQVLESVFLSISGITKLSSTSSEGQSVVSISFDWNKNLDVATNDIRDKIDLARNALPEGANTPIIFRLNLNTMIPVMILNLSGLDMNSDELKVIAEDKIIPYLEQINGVASVNTFGGRQRQVRVEVTQNRLEAYNITMGDISRSIAAQNVQVSAGNINMGDSRLLLRTAGEFANLTDIEDVVITYRPVPYSPTTTTQGSSWSSTSTNLSAGGNSPRMVPIRVRDVADVFWGFADADSHAEVNGVEALNLNIQRQSGSNAVDVSKALRRQIPVLNAQLPDGIDIEIIYDTSKITSNSIAQVVNSALSGLLLIIFVLLIFLRNIKSALIVSITMPLSIFTTLMFMYFFDLTLNIISLTGLTLGVGMVVDSAIVIIENIYRYREKGVKSTTAAHLGTSEMALAITASTLTTVAVFLPMVLFQKELQLVGVLLGDLAFTIVIALISSLVFSITVVPVLAGSFLAIDTPKQKPLKGFMAVIDRGMERILSWLDAKYARGIEWSLNHRWSVIFISFGTLAASIVLLMSPLIGTEQMPAMDSQTFTINFTLPVDSTIEATIETGQSFSRRYQEVIAEKNVGKAASFYILSAGGSNMGFGGSLNEGSLDIILDDDFKNRPLSINQMQDIARGIFSEYPGVEFGFSAGGPPGSGGGSALTINISGNDQRKLEEVANTIVEILRTVPEVKEPTSNLSAGIPETIIIPNRDKAGAFGVPMASIGSEIRSNINGSTVSIYRADGEEIDLFLVLRPEDRMSIRDLDRIYVNSQVTGTRIPIANLVEIEEGISPMSIRRENQTRQATVSANAGLRPDGKPFAPSIVSEAAWRAINRDFIPVDGVTIKEAGDNQDFIDLIPIFLAVIAISIILVYGIMASQFESLKDPFIIILSIVTMPIGPILIYAISGQPFSSFSVIGMIMLIGIIVNTGIILVDYINLLRKRGTNLREAVIETGRLRLRPILMTTLTTILGMIPLATATGDGTSMTQPIGVTVVGGMISSSIMTLFLVPVLYYMFNQKGERKRVAQQQREHAILLERRQQMNKEANHE
ncbi:efflux RND transporter permease subunit [Entomospira culicis]|uniref:Efflux RND transporter permease subunit n=1 Tax=Entomospira culicis TaxID=2719989 RepID=A0A968GER0_9SPIO|nr:efflux RND transporter permease subunit [Entomospira culicis]NIZ18974.1 efflux RND transporter permease subunit [Entomospira culicis]NIZ69189.1 efflux RND transporter permease subunit [Entomospira culicis]WDI37775.1 efflux RND transporter permease subunit [Entomospira culicis]WDI39403.1 efflux RND transporter permease subunit [Entomospira culicis]